MKIALGQINPLIGAFARNCQKICAYIRQAEEQGCDLIIFPELALVGYPPLDFLEKPDFYQESFLYWDPIVRAAGSIGVICGVVSRNEGNSGKPYYNSALFCHQGKIQGLVHKRLLPTYDVFDERRYFEPGQKAGWFDFKGRKLGITICEDIWTLEPFLPRQYYRSNPVQDLAVASIDCLINLSSSPFHIGKSEIVEQLLLHHALSIEADCVYVNQVGGNDELLFQGHSVVLDRQGRIAASGADFAEDLVVWDTEQIGQKEQRAAVDKDELVFMALISGLRDYADKCGFKRAVLGLSGGIDSAVTACLAARALGPENVQGVAMPGPYNAPESFDDARELASRLGIGFETVPIGDLFEMSLKGLQGVFHGQQKDTTEENLQSRLRGLILMAFSNKFCSLLLNTGNKSELAVGYCTLYGDMNGGLSVLGDVPKKMVYRLAEYINSKYGTIPERIITKPPSAELRPNQKDEDSLPAYDQLDSILAAYVEEQMPAEKIISLGWDRSVVEWVVRRVTANEYKRRQAPPVLRVTSKAFGMGRIFPIAHGYHEMDNMDGSERSTAGCEPPVK